MQSPLPKSCEPRWPAVVGLLAVNAMFYALPPTLKVGPDWVFILLVAALTLPGAMFRSTRRLPVVRILG